MFIRRRACTHLGSRDKSVDSVELKVHLCDSGTALVDAAAKAKDVLLIKQNKEFCITGASLESKGQGQGQGQGPGPGQRIERRLRKD